MGVSKGILSQRLHKLATGVESMEVLGDKCLELIFQVEFLDSVAP